MSMNMVFFRVPMFMNMRLTDRICVFVNMMNILVIVQMRMNRLWM